MATSEVDIYTKPDRLLSKKEIHGLFMLYNEIFCDNRISGTKKTNLAKDAMTKSDIFDWYIARVGGQIVGMASFVRNMEKANGPAYDIRPDRGENICSVAVAPKWRQRGIARMLMQTIIGEHGGEMDLVVEIKRENKLYYGLRTFYESLSFKEYDEDNLNEHNLFLRRKKE